MKCKCCRHETPNVVGSLAMANFVLASFANAKIERRTGGWYVCWGDVSRRWSVRHGQDFYPPWSRKFPGGGTAITALSQLIRWLKGMPVLPITTWRYWAGDSIKLLPYSTVDIMETSGYPRESPCVLCGRPLNGPLDWWSLDGLSGPCCTMRNGCKQVMKELPKRDTVRVRILPAKLPAMGRNKAEDSGT
jgi:hypothetical protein